MAVLDKSIHSLAIWSEHKLYVCFVLKVFEVVEIKVNDSVTMHFTKYILIYAVDYAGGIMLPDCVKCTCGN
jgi:hypothetical protein